MSRTLKILVVLIAMLVLSSFLFSVALFAEVDYFKTLGIQKPSKEIEAVDFSVVSMDGQEVNLKDFKGKVIFLNFWATWCGPCKMEVKDIDNMYKKLKNKDFAVLAVDVQEDSKKIKSFMKEQDLSFPVYIDKDGKISYQYGVRGIPTTYIIGKDWKIVGRAVGPRPWGSEDSIKFMENLIKK
ncbi:MAG: TlpA family protein disulfide reductase [Spirochaetes bacterium]|nr:MAG: TlpA family protein disulfide reductase [Spirochaetota bacterium]